MTALAAPFGFRPIRSQGSAPFSAGNEHYRITSGFATSMFFGTPVALDATGKLIPCVAGMAGYIGIFVGVAYEDPTFGPIQRQHWTGGTITKDAQDALGYVADDPDLIMAAQIVGAANFSSLTNIGKRLNITFTAPPNHGNLNTGNSTIGVSQTVSATGEFLLLGVLNRPDNPDASGWPVVVGVIAGGIHITRKA